MSPQSDCIFIQFNVSLPQFFSLFQVFCLQSFSHGAIKRIKASEFVQTSNTSSCTVSYGLACLTLLTSYTKHALPN